MAQSLLPRLALIQPLIDASRRKTCIRIWCAMLVLFKIISNQCPDSLVQSHDNPVGIPQCLPTKACSHDSLLDQAQDLC